MLGRVEEVGEAGIDLVRVADPDDFERTPEATAQRHRRIHGAHPVRESAHRAEDRGPCGFSWGRGVVVLLVAVLLILAGAVGGRVFIGGPYELPRLAIEGGGDFRQFR